MAAAARLNRVLNQYQFGKLTKEELKSRIRSGAFGRIIGVVGPFVCRFQKGRQIISERALMFRKSMTPAAIEGRSNFASKVKFAKFLNSIDDLRIIWNIAEIEGKLAWQRIIKHNNIKKIYPTISNSITPAKYHFYIAPLCSLNEDYSLTLKNKCRDDEKLITIIVPYEPKNKGDEPFSIFQINNNQMTDEQVAVCCRYNKYVIYSAVIRLGENGIEWSNTAAVEGAFKIEEKKCGEELTLQWLFIVQNYMNIKNIELRECLYTPHRYVLRL